MGSLGRRNDALGIFLTGGAANKDPALSLGGVPSAVRFRGFGTLAAEPISIPALKVDNAWPANGAGTGKLGVDASGNFTWTPPGGAVGTGVAIAAGASGILEGASEGAAVRVYVDPGYTSVARTVESVELLEIFNGALAMANLSSAQRVAGRTTYRAVLLSAVGKYSVAQLRLWLPPVGSQATWSLGLETPVAGALQTIANETTAPAGISWSSPTTEGAALTVASLAAGSSLGLWIRRVFPSGGVVSARESVRLSIKFKGA